jgi:hypothetical protein
VKLNGLKGKVSCAAVDEKSAKSERNSVQLNTLFIKYMPEASVKMDKSRMTEIKPKGILRRLMLSDKLSTWATKRRTKEREKRVQPDASSPSLRNDFTFTDMKKQVRMPIRRRMSRRVDQAGVDENPPTSGCKFSPSGMAKDSGLTHNTSQVRKLMAIALLAFLEMPVCCFFLIIFDSVLEF